MNMEGQELFGTQTSEIFKVNYESTARIIINQGGTWSGKTYSILEVLIKRAIDQPNLWITVVGQDIPNLKSGPIRDIQRIFRASQILEFYIKGNSFDIAYNKSDRELFFKNGSVIEFKSFDDEQDAHSGKRDYLFVNEANGIPFPIFKQLQLRTECQTFIDYNPSAEFWVHEIVLANKELYPSTQLVISDHRHNNHLSKERHDSIERLRFEDEETWKVYARGLTGKIEGLILKNWHICDEIPPDAKPVAHGLDFGFTNDETGCLEVYMQDGELWVNELFYETQMTNLDISARLKSLGVSKNREIIADSAEPKSIEELKREGWFITPALKGPDSIKNGLDILKRYKINITINSVNLRKELGRYIWKKDKLGKSLNVPIDAYNHLIDPLRYVALNKLKINNIGKATARLPKQQQNFIDPSVARMM